MCRFTFIKNKYINGSIDVYNLQIRGKDVFEDFNTNLEAKHEKDFRKFIFYLEMLSSGKRLAHNKIKKIRGIENGWELKAGSLRLYYLVFEPPLIVVCHMGYKKKQKKDIGKWQRNCPGIIEALIDQNIHTP
jgi:hypothetical protein